MARLATGLLTLLGLLSLVPGVWFIGVSPRFLAASPGQETPLRMWLLVIGIWLYPLTVLASLTLAWRYRRPLLALAPGAHVAILLVLVVLMGTFA